MPVSTAAVLSAVASQNAVNRKRENGGERQGGEIMEEETTPRVILLYCCCCGALRLFVLRPYDTYVCMYMSRMIYLEEKRRCSCLVVFYFSLIVQ